MGLDTLLTIINSCYGRHISVVLITGGSSGIGLATVRRLVLGVEGGVRQPEHGA